VLEGKHKYELICDTWSINVVTMFGSVAAGGGSVTTMAMRVHYPSPPANSLTQRCTDLCSCTANAESSVGSINRSGELLILYLQYVG